MVSSFKYERFPVTCPVHQIPSRLVVLNPSDQTPNKPHWFFSDLQSVAIWGRCEQHLQFALLVSSHQFTSNLLEYVDRKKHLVGGY